MSDEPIQLPSLVTYKDRTDDVYVEGPVGTNGAVLETTLGWEVHYRVRNGDKVTEWGTYEHIYYLDGRAYISPYWGDGADWREGTADEILTYAARTERTK